MSRYEQKRRRPLLPVLVLFLVLLLAGCSTGSDADRRVPSGEPAAVIVATVASEEVASPVPTALPPTVTPTATPPAPLAALVNGQYVFLSDYEQRVAQFEQALFEQGIDPQTDEGQAELDQARQDVLQGMIDSVLIEQGGLELGIGLTEEELESQVEADIASGGQEAFDEWLQITGQTRDDYKALLREALISQRVMDAVTVDVGTEAEQVHARHILLDSEEAAQEVLALLEQGADFVTVTRDYSLDQATKDNGGDLGWFPRKLVPPELESAAFALQPGQVSGVVRLGDGYHIIQVVEREEVRPLPPEMQLDLKLAIFEEWLAERRVAAEIERFAE